MPKIVIFASECKYAKDLIDYLQYAGVAQR